MAVSVVAVASHGVAAAFTAAMRSPQQLLLLSAALALCAAHTTVVELPATLDPMYTLDREDLRFYASLFDVEQSSSSSSSSIPVGDGGDGTATSERCPWQVVPPRNERVCLVLSEFTPSLYLHNTHDTPAEWNGWHPAMSELPCATRVAAQCARAPTADEAPRHSSATVRDAWSGDSDADDFGRSGRCGFAVAESPVCAHCRNPHLENFDRRCVCVSDDVASGLELDIASSSHSMCIVVAHGVRVMGGVRVATGSGSDVVVVAGALAYDPFSALAFASGVPTADSIDLGDGDDVLLVVAGGSLHSRLVVNAGDGADRVVVRGGGALGTLVPGRGGDRVLLERGALMSGTLNRTAPDAGDTWGDDVYVFNGLVVGELDVSEASAVYVGECALLRGGMRTVDGGDCSTVRLHTLLVASGAAVSGGRPSGGQWHGTDAVFVHTGASLRARIGGALTGTALHSLQHVDAIFYSSASMLNGGRSLCSDFDYGTSQIECAKVSTNVAIYSLKFCTCVCECVCMYVCVYLNVWLCLLFMPS